MVTEASQESPLRKIQIEFEPDHEIELRLLLVSESTVALDRGCIITVQFAESDGTLIKPPYEGWATGTDGCPFLYASVERDDFLTGYDGAVKSASSQRLRSLPPPLARTAEFSLKRWHSKSKITICQFEAVAIPVIKMANNDDKPVHQQTLRCGPNTGFLIEFELANLGQGDPRGALLIGTFHDQNGGEVQGPVEGLNLSNEGYYYSYINTSSVYASENGPRRGVLVVVPDNAVSMKFELRRWRDKHLFSVKSGFQITEAEEYMLIERVREFVGRPNSLEARNLMQRILDHVRARGQIVVEQSLLRLITGTALDQRVRKRLPVVEGTLRELRTDWLPLPTGKFARATPLGPQRRVLSLVKICRPYENTGGAVRNEKIFGGLNALGWEQYAVTPLGYPGRLADESTPFRTDVEGVPHLHLNIPDSKFDLSRPDYLLRYEAALLASVYRKIGGQIIHAVSGYRGYESALKALALKAMFGMPVLYDFRSLHEHTWSPPSSYSRDAQQTLMRAAQEDRCVREADHCVVISQAMKSILTQRGADPERITVIPNGVDVSRFSDNEAAAAALRAELGIPRSAPVHGYISNFSVREGHIHLLWAQKLILEECPGARCLLVGDGPRRAELEKLAGNLGIADSVIFTGEIPHENIAPYYAIYDVFVVPRINDYASDYVTPLKPFEAMASGVPVVMSDLPVTPEIIGVNGERGLTATPGAPEDLARVIKCLFLNRRLARSIGEAGLDWVSRERQWACLIEKYGDIYEDLIGLGPRDEA